MPTMPALIMIPSIQLSFTILILDEAVLTFSKILGKSVRRPILGRSSWKMFAIHLKRMVYTKIKNLSRQSVY